MNHAHRFAPLAVFVIVPSVLILPILFSGKMLSGDDVESVFHSQRIVIAQSFREGRLPVWDPHVMAGFPLLAAVQGAVFYPPTWLCVLMSAGAFWTMSAWAHLILAGVFAHRWLERGVGLSAWAALAGAFVFMLSGYLVGHLHAGHVNYVWAYPWTAALLWRAERFFAGPTLKRGVLIALVLAMLFLAGVPQFVYFSGLLLLARGLHFILSEKEGRKERGRVAGKAVAWLAWGLLLCAPQLFPTLELIGEMQRGSSDDQEFNTQHDMRPSKVVEILWPPNKNSYYPFWERCAFLGGGALLLLLAAFAGKHGQRYLWAGIAGVALLMAMGLHTPVYPGITWLLPGAGLFRGPGRYLLLFTLGAAALVAIGVDTLVSRWRMSGRIAAGVLSLVSAVQLSLFAHKMIEEIDPWRMESVSWLSAVQQAVGPDGRIATTTVEDIGGCQLSGVDTVCGYDPMMLRRYTELMNVAQGYPPEKNIVLMASVGNHPVVDMLAVRGWLIRDFPSGPGSFHPPRTMPKKVRENAGILPRAWMVNNAVVIESRDERLRVLAKGPWDPRKTVVLEQYPNEAPPVTTEGPAGRAKVVSKKPGEYVLEAENPADAYLVLSEAYYPGWSAEVDGKPAEVLPANHLIQAIRLPPGKHVVRVAYRSRFLGAGFAVALLGALVPVALVLVRRRRG